MKHLFSLLLAGCCFAWSAGLAGEPPPAPPSSPARPTLAVVVVETTTRSVRANDDFERIAEEFEQVFAGRGVPFDVKVERFAANNEAHTHELRVFYRGIDDEFGEKVFRAWMTLTVRGTKHDFGIVVYRYWPRPAENVDDVIRKLFRGAAGEAADRVTPHLVTTPTG